MRTEFALTDHIGQEKRGREIAELAARQHGVIAHRQLAQLGVSDRQVYRWIRSGRLHRIHRGVYALGHKRLTQQGRWMAAVLAGGDGIALSNLCAAGNWELTEAFPSLPQITAPTRRRQRSGLTVYVADLAPNEIAIPNGIQ